VGNYELEIMTVPEAKITGDLTFTISDNGETLLEYVERHTKNLHLIAVSEDLSNFLHVHPELTASGVWKVKMLFPEGGKWRIYTDFATVNDEDGVILGKDVDVVGKSTKRPLDDPRATFSSNGFDISLSGTIPADGHGMLMVTVMKDGNVVNFEEYLGSSGHLIAIRESDGAYAHFHPQGHDHGNKITPPATDGATVTVSPNDDGVNNSEGLGSGMSMTMPGMLHFDTEVPGAGRYGMFLEFMSGGKLYQIAFTANIA
jgi:hypothetical protein